MQGYSPSDPYYDEVIDQRGKVKKVKVGSSSSSRLSPRLTTLSHQRSLPEGLSKRDQKALKKIRKRAHYLDKGMNLCGFRVGWTFFIGKFASRHAFSTGKAEGGDRHHPGLGGHRGCDVELRASGSTGNEVGPSQTPGLEDASQQRHLRGTRVSLLSSLSSVNKADTLWKGSCRW